jgi:hypothetical protein
MKGLLIVAATSKHALPKPPAMELNGPLNIAQCINQTTVAHKILNTETQLSL